MDYTVLYQLSNIFSYIREDKWEQLQNDKLVLLMSTKWKIWAYIIESLRGLHQN